MNQNYIITFADKVDTKQVEACLGLALIAVSAIAGEEAVDQQVDYDFDANNRRLSLTLSGSAGEGFRRALLRFLEEEIGREQFAVSRETETPNTPRLVAVAVVAIR